MHKIERVSRALAGVIARKCIGEEVQAKRILMRDVPKAIASMIDEMWPELESEAKAAIDAIENEEVN